MQNDPHLPEIYNYLQSELKHKTKNGLDTWKLKFVMHLNL